MKTEIEVLKVKNKSNAYLKLFFLMALLLLVDNNGYSQLDNIPAVLEKAYGWFKIICFLAFVVIIIVGGITVYGKTQGENPESFMKAATGWFKGLVFLLIFFAFFSGIKALWSATIGNSTLTN